MLSCPPAPCAERACTGLRRRSEVHRVASPEARGAPSTCRSAVRVALPILGWPPSRGATTLPTLSALLYRSVQSSRTRRASISSVQRSSRSAITAPRGWWSTWRCRHSTVAVRTHARLDRAPPLIPNACSRSAPSRSDRCKLNANLVITTPCFPRCAAALAGAATAAE